MILRRVIAHLRKQEWTAIGIDFVIVVVGVFVASLVTDWNTARIERAAERVAIDQLIVEYNQNLAQLGEHKATHQRALAATERLLAMIGPNSRVRGDTSDIGRTLIDCLTNPTFNPGLGATNSLLASGDLALIRDPELRSMLAAWPASAEEVLEWQVIERHHGEELIAGLSFDYVAWPDVYVELGRLARPSAFESDYDALLASRRFEGLLSNRQWNLRDIITEIEELETETTRLIERLESRRARL